jgi:hypothetical protein
MTTEINKFVQSIAKRVYPLTEKEKNCLEEFGKMHIKRGHLSKAIIETISKYDQTGTTQVLDSQPKQDEPNY